MRVETGRESKVLQVRTVPDEMVTRVCDTEYAYAREYSILAPERFRNRGPGANTQDL